VSPTYIVKLLDAMSVSAYCTLCRKSLANFIVRILASCVNSKMIHKRWRHGPWTAYLLDGAVSCIALQFLCRSHSARAL